MSRNINTINICISHVPFPEQCSHFVDLSISPKSFGGQNRTIVVEDNYFGEAGSALSEYAQLLWLGEHLDEISSGFEYVRLFQYRRFVSRRPIGIPVSLISRWTHVKNLSKFENEFDRHGNGELFTPPGWCLGGVRGQYGRAHVGEDFSNFSNYLSETGILDPPDLQAFIKRTRLIPACSTGTYRVETLRSILPILRSASGFLQSKYYVARSGYQRRLMGFLLERLHSHLLLRRIESGLSSARFGHYVVFSDNPLWHVWRWKPKSLSTNSI